MAHPFDPVFPINRKWTFQFAEEYIKTGISDKLPIGVPMIYKVPFTILKFY